MEAKHDRGERRQRGARRRGALERGCGEERVWLRVAWPLFMHRFPSAPSSRPCYPSPPLFTAKLPPPPPFAKLPSTAFLQARLPITISPRRRRVGGELRLAGEINGGGEVMEGSLAVVRGRRWSGACRGEVLEGAWRRGSGGS